jgi:hypothetical protein
VALTGLVILAADDQKVVFFVHTGLGPYIVVRILCIPIQRLWDKSFGHETCDHVGQVRSLLGVHGESVIDGAVGGDHDGVGAKSFAAHRLNGDRPFAFRYLRRHRAAIDPATVMLNRVGKASDIPQRVKLGLAGKTQARSLERALCNVIYPRDVRQPCAVRRTQFFLQEIIRAVLAAEQETLDPCEAAIDPFPRNCSGDVVNRRRMALRANASSLDTVAAFDFKETIIDGIR